MIAVKPKWYKRVWHAVKAAWKRVRRPVWEATYFTAGVTASAYVMVKTLPLWLATLVFVTLFTHEFGHYFSARIQKREVRLPFFIPLYYGLTGGTRVKGEDPISDMKIALAGPEVGIVVALVALVFFGVTHFMPGVWASLWILGFQLYSGTLGHDGRKYWRARSASVLGSPTPSAPTFARAVP